MRGACAKWLAAAILCTAAAPARAASGDLGESIAHLAQAWRAGEASVVVDRPRFLNDDEKVSIVLPELAPAECITVALLGPRGLGFHVRVVGEGDEDRDARILSQAGAVSIERCGVPPPRVLLVTSDSGRGALEVAVARSRGSLPALPVVLSERGGASWQPGPEPGPTLPLGPPERRADAADARARREGAAVAARVALPSGPDGSGGASQILPEGCHVLRLFAAEPRDRRSRGAKLDLDAELRQRGDERVLSRDRSDAPDVELSACVGEPTAADLVFVGSPPRAPVLMTHYAWTLPSHLPAIWGGEVRGRVGRILLARHVASLPREPSFLTQGGSGTTPIALGMEPGACYLAIVAAAQGTARALGLRVRVGGREASDERGIEGAGAAVAFLALAPAIGASTGCAAFRGPGGGPPGGLARPQSPLVTQGQLDARGLLGDLPERATRLGASEPSVVASGEAVENGWVGAFVEVPSDACLLAYARAASSVDDVDVAVYSDEGAALAVDEGRDVHPTVVLCPPHPDRVYVAGHVVDGEGLVAVGAQIVPRARGEIVGRSLGARGGLAGGPRPATAWPGLDEVLRTHRVELGGKWEEFRRVALPVDARLPTTVAFPVDADQCVDALVLADSGASELDVEALDGEGRVVARARSSTGPSTLTVCSPIGMAGTLSIRPHVGLGLAAVVLGRAPADVAQDLAARPDLEWIPATVPVETANKQRDALLAKSGYDVPKGNASGSLALGRRTSIPLDLRPLGTPCGRIDIVGGAPLGLVEATVRDDSGSLLAGDRASSTLTLFACGRGMVHLDLEALGRPGPYAVSLRPERWSDPVFAAHPLAASRMLGRSAHGHERLLAGRETAVRAAALSADRTTAWSEAIAPGKCLSVTAGVEGQGTGIDLAAFDETGAAVDRAEGARATGVRACAAPATGAVVRIEARASAGQLDAVLGERTQD